MLCGRTTCDDVIALMTVVYQAFSLIGLGLKSMSFCILIEFWVSQSFFSIMTSKIDDDAKNHAFDPLKLDMWTG